jgi:hypothetical protein
MIPLAFLHESVSVSVYNAHTPFLIYLFTLPHCLRLLSVFPSSLSSPSLCLSLLSVSLSSLFSLPLPHELPTFSPEAEFVDEIQTKVSRVFLLAPPLQTHATSYFSLSRNLNEIVRS